MDMSKKLSVAIDTGILESGHRVRGVGFQIRELFRGLKKLTPQASKRSIELHFVDFDKVDLSKYDIVHFQAFNPFLTSFRLIPGSKVIVTIDDTIPLLYPDQFPPGTRGRLRFFKQKQLLKHVDAVITISETSKKDIVRFLGVPAEKIFVTYAAGGPQYRVVTNAKLLAETRKKYNLPDKFVMYLGAIGYNKNVPTLVKACGLAKIPLVVVGKYAKDIENLDATMYSLEGPRDWLRFLLDKPHPEVAHYRLIKDLFREYNVIRPGYVSDDDLRNIFNLATVYCQPSYYEGFGQPVIQAMASGTPVVASQTQVLVEIAGKAALFADPDSPQDFAKRIRKLTKPETRKKYIALGTMQAKKYSWDKAAQETLDVYAKVGK